MAGVALEIELKARVRDMGSLRERLRGLGARVRVERQLEDNLLLDDAGSGLGARREVLRVRLAGGKALLTWKGMPAGDTADAHGLKVREELETEAADGVALLAVLERLGYRSTFRYQRYRETWELGTVEVCLDETPAGDYLEIEGAPSDVREAARRLGVEPADHLAESYPTLFRRLLRERAAPAAEMVFPSPSAAQATNGGGR